MADLSLVTGGAGFIGSNLARALLARGEGVRVLDDFSSGLRENLEEIRQDIDLVEGDVRDPDACRRACRDVNVVFHEAAIASVPRSLEDPRTSFAVNALGTFNLLAAARDAGARPADHGRRLQPRPRHGLRAHLRRPQARRRETFPR